MRRDREPDNEGDIIVNDFLEVMNSLSGQRKEKLQKIFANVPYWMLEQLKVCNLQKNTAFIKRGEPASMIYVLTAGNVKAADDRLFELVYDYTWFEPVEVFGAMELYMGYDKYITTLITATKCRLIGIPRNLYKECLMKNADMVLEQTRDMMRTLNDQARKEREFQFLSGTERLAYLFLLRYRQHAVDGKLTIRLTREEMAKQSGTNVRTVWRSLREMQDKGLVCKSGRYITIEREQYEKIKERLLKETEIELN